MFPRWWWRSGTLFVLQSYTMLCWKSLVIKLSDVNVRGHLQSSWCVFDAFMFFWCFNRTALFLSLLFHHSLFIQLIPHYLLHLLSFFVFLSLSLWSLSVLFSLRLSSCRFTFSFPLSLSLVLRLSLSLSLWLSLSSSPFFSTSDSLALYFNLSLRLLSHSFFFCLNVQIFSVCLRPSSPVLPFLSLSLSLCLVWLYQSFWLLCLSLVLYISFCIPPLLQLSFQ